MRTSLVLSIAGIAYFTLCSLAKPIPAPGYDKLKKEAIPLVHEAVDIQTKVLDHAIDIKKQGLPIRNDPIDIRNLYNNHAYTNALPGMREHRFKVDAKKQKVWEYYQKNPSDKALDLHLTLTTAKEILKSPSHEESGLRTLERMAKGSSSRSSDRDVSELESRKTVLQRFKDQLPKGKSSWFHL